MDQNRIGKFIAACRKEKGLTQLQLADKLGITDRAISKWENGKALPDSSIMLELCGLLDITVNDLLSGEKVSSETYTKNLEEKLMEVIQEKEKSDKLLMRLRVLILLMMMVGSFTMVMLVEDAFSLWSYGFLVAWWILYFFSTFVISRISRLAGYYKCEVCGKAYVPTARETIFATGWTANRQRFKCRHCGQRSFHKKVYRKGETP